MQSERTSGSVTKLGLKSGAVVEIRGLSKWFGEMKVLTNVSLDVGRGEKVVICGPSGSGKSTLIRCINGLESHQEGDVFVCGERTSAEAKSLVSIRRRVGMVFQQFNLYPHLTVLENCILSPAHVLKLPRQEAIELARAYLDKVRLAEHEHKLPSQLSGGQQQRVAIARALCMKPEIMLFDEPTSALDPELVREVLDVITGLAEEGMAMICVTHEMGFARNMADRIVFMDRGTIVESCHPSDFFTNARHERVRTFLNQISH